MRKYRRSWKIANVRNSSQTLVINVISFFQFFHLVINRFPFPFCRSWFNRQCAAQCWPHFSCLNFYMFAAPLFHQICQLCAEMSSFIIKPRRIQPISRSSPRYLANRKPSLPHPLPLKVIVTVKKCAKQCHTEQCKHYIMHGPLLLLMTWQHFAYSK